MATSMILHRVADYDHWRRVYDSVKGMQGAGGVIEERVWRMNGDENNILVMHRFATVEQARTFFDSAELHEALQEAGVDGSTVRIEFFDEA